MISSRLVFSGLFIVLVHFFIGSVSGQSGAANNTNATSVTTNLPPATSNITSTTVATPAKNATASDDEEECEDEPEAEGPAKNGTSADRQGKGLIIIQGGDKDKYTHENGTAEPEAESEPGTNSTSSGLNGKRIFYTKEINMNYLLILSFNILLFCRQANWR